MRGTNHNAEPETTARPSYTNGQCDGGGRATRRHANQLDLLPPPRPSTKEKKESSGNRDPCQSLRKARPHPAQQPMVQQRTDKDIPWEMPRPITGGRGGTFAIC